MADELYLFNINGVNKGFTPTLFNKTLGAVTYYPAIIKCSEIRLTDNFAKSPVTFTFDALNSFAKSILLELPETPILVTIFKAGVTYWTGAVLSVTKPNLATIAVTCDNIYALTAGSGKRYRMNLHCNHQIYDSMCKVVDSDFVVNGTTTATSTVLTVSGLTKPTGYFNNGKALMQGQVRRIIDSNGTTIRLSSPFTGNLSGLIALYPGCNGTRTNCIAFNNLNNGLFFGYQSSKNPYGNTGLL